MAVVEMGPVPADSDSFDKKAEVFDDFSNTFKEGDVVSSEQMSRHGMFPDGSGLFWEGKPNKGSEMTWVVKSIEADTAALSKKHAGKTVLKQTIIQNAA